MIESKICEVWIASHFHSQQRMEWAKEMFLSLANQTDKNFIIKMSWSKETYIAENLENMVYFLFGNRITLFRHETRKTQFEHIKCIFDNSHIENQDNLILFCDDDDMYHKTRIECIKNIAIQYNKTKFFKDYSVSIFGEDTYQKCAKNIKWNAKSPNGLVFELKSAPGENDSYQDFANNICYFSLIDEFFKEKLDIKYVTENPTIQGVLDCVFSSWLIENYKTNDTDIKQILYLKRMDRFFPSMAISWNKKKDFDFENVSDEWKLKDIFFKMTDINFAKDES